MLTKDDILLLRKIADSNYILSNKLSSLESNDVKPKEASVKPNVNRNYIISVTTETINRARKIPNGCAIYLAIKEKFGLDKGILVYPQYCLLLGNTYYFPELVTDFIFKWDRGLPVEPITFELKKGE